MDESANHTNSQNACRSDEDRVRLARRGAILSGLGKGSAALAAMSPLASHAVNVRSHKLANGALPGGFGYCTISGFQSAAVSGSPPPTVCSAYAPSRFVATEALTYTSGNLGINGEVKAKKLRDALNGKYFPGAPSPPFTETNVGPLLNGSQQYVAVAGTGIVLVYVSNNSSTALTRKNWPDAGLDGLTAFNSATLFNTSTDSRPLLSVLYDGVLSSTPATANTWFVSAWLTVYTSTPSYLPSGFDLAYLKSMYSSATAGSDTYQFLKTLCTTP